MPNNEQATQANAVGAKAPELSEFEAVKARLEEISAAVADDDMPLDEALDLYEEAVKLGLQVSDLLELGIDVEDSEDAGEASAADGSQGAENADDSNDSRESSDSNPSASVD